MMEYRKNTGRSKKKNSQILIGVKTTEDIFLSIHYILVATYTSDRTFALVQSKTLCKKRCT